MRKIASDKSVHVDDEAVTTVLLSFMLIIYSYPFLQRSKLKLLLQLRELLVNKNFHLVKWFSNQAEVLSFVPDSNKAISLVGLELCDLPEKKIWIPEPVKGKRIF